MPRRGGCIPQPGGLPTGAWSPTYTPRERAAALWGQPFSREAYLLRIKTAPAGILVLDVGKGELLSLYVAPAFWGRGAGSALMSFTLARLGHCGRVFLTVMSRNTRARRFYEKQGFALEVRKNLLRRKKTYGG